jgi:uncharacterized protein (DUF1778 family)
MSRQMDQSTNNERSRSSRLGFRVDRRAKTLVQRAADLERRSLTDYCLTTLVEAAQKTIARHETLTLSDQDRKVFFDTLIHPPKINPRLRRAFKVAQRRVEP